MTAAEYAQAAAQSSTAGTFINLFDKGRLERRQTHVLEILRQTLKVLLPFSTVMLVCLRMDNQ
jgi:hypothetical protein